MPSFGLRKIVFAGWAVLLLAGPASAQRQTLLDQVGTLSEELALYQPQAEAFIGSWTATGLACERARRLPFGNLRQPCRQIRSALRDGEFLLFARRCSELGKRHTVLVENYRALAAEPLLERNALETVLLDNEEHLIALCSLSIWQARHPVFAGLRVEAADPRYRTPDNRFYADHPDYRLRSALESTLGATTAGASRDAPVTGAGSFVTGPTPDSN